MANHSKGPDGYFAASAEAAGKAVHSALHSACVGISRAQSSKANLFFTLDSFRRWRWKRWLFVNEPLGRARARRTGSARRRTTPRSSPRRKQVLGAGATYSAAHPESADLFGLDDEGTDKIGGNYNPRAWRCHQTVPKPEIGTV